MNTKLMLNSFQKLLGEPECTCRTTSGHRIRNRIYLPQNMKQNVQAIEYRNKLYRHMHNTIQ